MTAIAAVVSWVKAIWQRYNPKRAVVDVSPSVPLLSPPVAEVVTTASKTRRQRRPDIASDHAFVHVTDVLDLLPRCRSMMRRLRKVDNHAYRFWRTIGVRLLGDDMAFLAATDLSRLTSIKANTKGMVFFYLKDHKQDDAFPGHFVYFDEVTKNPWHCAIPRGSRRLFKVTIVWTDEPGKALNFAYEFYISFNDTGMVELCSAKYLEQVKLPKGGGFTKANWGIPPGLEWHWKQLKDEGRGQRFASPEELAVLTFGWALDAWVKTSDQFQVRAERDKVSVSFNIPPGISSKFFRDRETDVAADGRRRRIFHAVREHERVLADGETSVVKAHYRGERSFTWKGEAITITPSERGFGKTFNLLATEGEGKVPKDMVDLADYAPKVRAAVEAEWRKNVASAQKTVH